MPRGQGDARPAKDRGFLEGSAVSPDAFGQRRCRVPLLVIQTNRGAVGLIGGAKRDRTADLLHAI
jgi:hypothetical protein